MEDKPQQFRGRGRQFSMCFNGWLEILARHKAPGGAGLLLWGLLRAGHNHDCVRVSDRRLAELTGMGVRSVYNMRAVLADIGIVRFASGLSCSGNKANFYQLIPPPAEPAKPGGASAKIAEGVTQNLQKGSAKFAEGARQELQKGPANFAEPIRKIDRPIDNIDISIERKKKILRGSVSGSHHELLTAINNSGVNPRKGQILAVRMCEAGMDVADWKCALANAAAATLAGQTRRSRAVNLKRLSPDVLEAVAAYAVGVVECALEQGDDHIRANQGVAVVD